MNEERRRDNFFALLERYNQLGRLLPDPDAVDRDNVADVKIITAEMDEVKKQIDALLDAS